MGGGEGPVIDPADAVRDSKIQDLTNRVASLNDLVVLLAQDVREQSQAMGVMSTNVKNVELRLTTLISYFSAPTVIGKWLGRGLVAAVGLFLAGILYSAATSAWVWITSVATVHTGK
jgi:hypothetical protein